MELEPPLAETAHAQAPAPNAAVDAELMDTAPAAAAGEAEAGHERPSVSEEDEPAAKKGKLLGKDIFLRGAKKELTAGQLFSTEEDIPLLHARLDALQLAWQLEHAPGARFVSFGVWPVGSRCAEVLLKRGKGWNAFGQHVGTRTLLFPEEALFLMESDRLVLFRSTDDEVPMSLHAVYAAAAATGISSERYAAFAHLCRLGFVVHQYGAPWFLDSRDAAPAGGEAGEGAGEERLPPVDELGAAETAAQGRGDGAAEAPAAAAAAASPAPAACDAGGVTTPAAGPGRAWWPRDGWPSFDTPSVVLLQPLPSAAEAAAGAWAPELLYDVWPPQSAFTKRRVGRPFFRVCLSTQRPPNATETAALARASGSVPVKCIIVKPGIVIGFDVGVSTSTSVPKKKGNR